MCGSPFLSDPFVLAGTDVHFELSYSRLSRMLTRSSIFQFFGGSQLFNGSLDLPNSLKLLIMTQGFLSL